MATGTLATQTIAASFKALLKAGSNYPVALASGSGSSERLVFGEDDAADVRTAIYVTQDRVGVNASDPGTLLEVRGDAGTGAASAGVLTLSTAETNVRVGTVDQLGRIDFQAPKESGGTDAILVSASIYAECEQDFSSSNNSTGLVFATGTSSAPIKAMRIRSNGNILFSTDVMSPQPDLPAMKRLEVHGESGEGAAIRICGGEGSTSPWLELGEDDGDDGSQKWQMLLSAGSNHLYWSQVTDEDWASSRDNEMRLGTSGILDTEGAMNPSQTIDYAEYFETYDGQAIAKGVTVVLIDGKIKAAQDGETPIGAIRPPGSSAMVAGGQVFHWKGKHVIDEYGQKQFTERIKTYKDGTTKKMYDPIINPDFDDSKEYIEREYRDEWQIVGLLGQVPINKGQPIASTWIKMGKVTDSVDMYFIK